MRIATCASLARLPASSAAMIERYREARRNLWTSPLPQLAPEPKRPPAQVAWPVPVPVSASPLPQPAPERLSVILTPRERTKRLSVKLIVHAVARYYDLPTRDLFSGRRTAQIVRPRQIAMWLARRVMLASLPHIGRCIGGRDHTTVLHGVRRIDELRAQDPRLARELQQLEAELRPPEEEAHVEGQEERRPAPLA